MKGEKSSRNFHLGTQLYSMVSTDVTDFVTCVTFYLAQKDCGTGSKQVCIMFIPLDNDRARSCVSSSHDIIAYIRVRVRHKKTMRTCCVVDS